MTIKVCGMRDAENIRAVEQLGVDWLGFIFWPKSSRYVSEKPSYLPTSCKRVGVFVDATLDEVCKHAREYHLDFIQLHGHESPDYIRELCAANGDACNIIKAISISNHADIELASKYDGIANYLLFDTRATTPPHSPAGLPGGTGQQFDWTLLADYDGQTPFLLSGGIGPDDAERVRDFNHPRCIGIDLNSRFETAPGLKDVNKLRKFIKKTRL